MNDTIYRQAAIDAVRKCSVKEVTPAYMLIDKPEAMTELMLLPSAQSEIVRCKDCIYASPNGKYGCKAYHFKLYETHEMNANDFCSRGERRIE